MKRGMKVVAPVLIFAVGLGLVALLYVTRPQVEKKEILKELSKTFWLK